MVLIIKGQEFVFNIRERGDWEERNDSRAYK
jgi:hypothetical protein